MSEQEKKVNPWVEHVKKYAKDNGISYMCAVTMAKASYKAPTKVKPEGKRAIKAKKEDERVKQLYKEPENVDVLQELLKKIDKRKQAKATKDKNKKERETEYAKNNLEVTSALGKYTVDQIKEKIEKIKDNIKKHDMFGKIPTDELIEIETRMWLDELTKRKKVKTAYEDRKTKEKKQKALKEKKKIEKELSEVAV